MLYVIQLNCKNVKNSFDYLFIFLLVGRLAIVAVGGVLYLLIVNGRRKQNKLPILCNLKNVIDIRTSGKLSCVCVWVRPLR